MEKDLSELYKDAGEPGAAAVRLVEILKLLRAPDGCPWDREQTHDSLRVCMSEEAFEAIDAIEKKNWDNLEEELGDLLLQSFFHSALAEEEGYFTLTSVINRECEKMIRRHPHVFPENHGKGTVSGEKSVDKALEKWENVKSKEKKGSLSEQMEDLPRGLPALTKSCKVQKKAAKVGFDWDSVEDAFSKVQEETDELLDCYQTGTPAKVEEELGDLLFAVVNVARFLDVDPEDALQKASAKFVRRFKQVETGAAQQGRKLEEMSLPEMDALWEQAKNTEKQTNSIL